MLGASLPVFCEAPCRMPSQYLDKPGLLGCLYPAHRKSLKEIQNVGQRGIHAFFNLIQYAQSMSPSKSAVEPCADVIVSAVAAHRSILVGQPKMSAAAIISHRAYLFQPIMAKLCK